ETKSLDPVEGVSSQCFPFTCAIRGKTTDFRPLRPRPSPIGAKTGPFGPNSRRSVMPTVSMTVNGKAVTADVDSRTLLVQFLRENLRLTGTHVGCDTSQCGACVVHVDGKARKSCTMFAWQAEGTNVTTIEGIAN